MIEESLATYSLGITVSDGTDTSSIETVTVNISDLNDNNPIVTSGQSFTVAENTTNGTSIGTIAATDADLSTTFSAWTIVSGNTGNVFALDSSTGALSVLNALDRESTASYTLTVNVSDGTNTSSNQTLTITISDANDNAPVITSGQILSVAENATSGTTLTGTPLTVTDADASTTYSAWAIVSGNTGTAFTINSSTGVISTNATLDRETIASYSLGITVSDGSNTSSAETVTINLGDINDNAPIVTSGQGFSLNEGTVSGNAVGSILVTDLDLSHHPF